MKALYVIGTSIAIGSVWFFSLYALLTQAIGYALTPIISIIIFIVCAVIGGIAGWKIFVVPARKRS